MDKIYHSFLWFSGFQKDEHISDLLARQKLRFGKWWWTFPILTIVFTLAFLALEIWLIIHIVTFKLKNK